MACNSYDSYVSHRQAWGPEGATVQLSTRSRIAPTSPTGLVSLPGLLPCWVAVSVVPPFDDTELPTNLKPPPRQLHSAARVSRSPFFPLILNPCQVPSIALAKRRVCRFLVGCDDRQRARHWDLDPAFDLWPSLFSPVLRMLGPVAWYRAIYS